MNLIALSNSVREVQNYVNAWNSQNFKSGLKNNMMTMCVATLDMALSRFNTSLLRCQQHPLIADEYYTQLEDCCKIINRFYKWMLHFEDLPAVLSWFPALILDWIGKRQIPKIKKLNDKVNNYLS